MRFFEVLTMFGHVGNGRFILLPLYIKAINKKEASVLAINTPRVKHHNKHVINSIKEITEEDYYIGCILNALNPYYECKSKREQLIRCPFIEDSVQKFDIKIEYRPSHYRKYTITQLKEKEQKDSLNGWRKNYVAY